MGERNRRVPSSDPQALEAAAEATHAAKPPAGHQRREHERMMVDDLMAKAEHMAQQLMTGNLDPKSLEIVNEIASKSQHLAVSNAKPGFRYMWCSKNRHDQHFIAASNLGWETVCGDDPEAHELKGNEMPGTTRELGDVILMRIPEERWLVLQAMGIARTRQMQKAASGALIQLVHDHRDNGVSIRPFNMPDPDGDLSGPPIQPRRFSSRKDALAAVDAQLRSGTVPGMVIERT